MIASKALTGRAPLASKIGVSVCVALLIAGVFLWAIPLFARETFGVSGAWDEPSDYLFSSLLASILGTLAPSWLIAPSTRALKRTRRLLIVFGIIATVVVGLTLTGLALLALGMGL